MMAIRRMPTPKLLLAEGTKLKISFTSMFSFMVEDQFKVELDVNDGTYYVNSKDANSCTFERAPTNDVGIWLPDDHFAQGHFVLDLFDGDKNTFHYDSKEDEDNEEKTEAEAARRAIVAAAYRRAQREEARRAKAEGWKVLQCVPKAKND